MELMPLLPRIALWGLPLVLGFLAGRTRGRMRPLIGLLLTGAIFGLLLPPRPFGLLLVLLGLLLGLPKLHIQPSQNSQKTKLR
jgi:hypothetical protein